MPSGLSNVPASFQSYINKILAKRLNIIIVVYWNNILIYTKNLRQPHVKIVRSVLKQMQKHDLYANLK